MAFADRGEPEAGQIQQKVEHSVETQIGYGYDEKEIDEERVSVDRDSAIAGTYEGQ